MEGVIISLAKKDRKRSEEYKFCFSSEREVDVSDKGKE